MIQQQQSRTEREHLHFFPCFFLYCTITHSSKFFLLLKNSNISETIIIYWRRLKLMDRLLLYFYVQSFRCEISFLRTHDKLHGCVAKKFLLVWMDTKKSDFIYKEVLFHEPPENFVKRIFPTEMTSEDWMGENKNLARSQSVYGLVYLFLWCVMYILLMVFVWVYVYHT
jgi:hypothetical protein